MKPLFAIALVLSMAAPAVAQEASLRFSDLDLSTAAGQAELERRIENATRQICRAEPTVGTRIVDRDELERCKDEVRAQITAKLPR